MNELKGKKYPRSKTFRYRGVVSKGGILPEDIRAYLRFTVTITTPSLSVPALSDYQTLLIEKITELRERGLHD